MKKVRNMNVKLTYYARETHRASNSLIEWWTFILLVGFANAMHRLPRFGGVTEMPLFSDTIEHGSTSVDAKPVELTAHGSWPWIATRNPTQESITRTHYDECLMWVDVSKSVGVQLRDGKVGVSVSRAGAWPLWVGRKIRLVRLIVKEKPLTQSRER